MNSTVCPYFPNLKEDDAIQSAPESGVYNCISWSGGITEYWEWPDISFSDHYGQDMLAAFDEFYGNSRYDKCGIFTREGATADSSVVDLWAIVGADGSREYTHASIRKGSDDHPHGYDWESKPGSLMRTFHPRNALSGSSYGQVVEYYRRIGTGHISTLAEAIADGSSVLENVQFTDSERAVISAQKASMSTSEISNFGAKYNAWKATWANSPFSNPRKFATSTQYNDLLSYCRSTVGSNYLVYEKLGEGDALTMILVEDLTLTNNIHNKTILDGIKASNAQMKTTSSGATIIRSPYSNAMTFVKKLLAGGSIAGRSTAKSVDGNEGTTGISYSNTDVLNVFDAGSEIFINFSLTEDAKISLSVLDLNGRQISALVNNQSCTSGNYNYSANISTSGIYLVEMVVNGNVNVKKVTVK